MAPEELKTLPKGHFVLAKTGTCPMRTQLPLFLKWGIQFGEAYEVAEQAARTVLMRTGLNWNRRLYGGRLPVKMRKSGGGRLEEEGTGESQFEKAYEEEHRKCKWRHDSPPRPPLRTD